MAKIEIVLKKIDMRQDVIEYHHVHPVRIIVIVIGNGRAGVYNRLVWVAGIQFVAAFFFKDFNIMNPVIVKRGYHGLGRQFE